MAFQSDEWKYFCYKMQERWERLGIQEWINRNPRAVIAIASGSFLLFFLMVFFQLMPDSPGRFQEPETVWFYDLNTKELFRAKSSNIPPIKSPSGPLPDGSPAGVRAYVYNETSDAKPVIALLEKFTPEGRKSRRVYDPQYHDPNQWACGRFFCRPGEEATWFAADSPEGKAIYKEYYLRKNNIEMPAEKIRVK
jgi:hypothetical protein